MSRIEKDRLRKMACPERAVAWCCADDGWGCRVAMVLARMEDLEGNQAPAGVAEVERLPKP